MENLDLKITNNEKHLNKISERFSDVQKSKLAKAAEGFEGMLTSMMLKSMTETTEGLFGEEGFGGGILDTVFQNELSSLMAKSNNMGIAEMIYEKLTGEKLEGVESVKKESSANKNPIKINTENAAPAISPSSKSLNKLEKFKDIIDEASGKYGVDKNLIKSVILTESAGNEKAVSVANAKGLMQLMDSTARNMGVKNVWNPRENIHGGTKYLSGLLRQYNGDVKLALAAYNAGPGNVNKYNGVPPFNETKNYITRVFGYLNHFNG